MRRKKNEQSGLGEEYDTIVELASKLGVKFGRKKRRYTIIDLRTGKRKIVNPTNRSTLYLSGKHKWKILVLNDKDEDIMERVMTALRNTKNYMVRKVNSRGKPRYINNLHKVINNVHYKKVHDALKKTGKVLCIDRKGVDYTIELFVPKWTGWTIEQVYGLSGEAIEFDITNKIDKKPVYQLDKETGEVIRCFNGVREAAREVCNNTDTPSRISKCCNGKRKSTGGYGWRYADDEEYV